MRNLVYIVAPYGASTDEERRQNVDRAVALCAKACDQGFAPMTVHPGIYWGAYGHDADPVLRERGLEIDLAWIDIVDKIGGELWVLLKSDGTLSSGSEREVKRWRLLSVDDDRGAYGWAPNLRWFRWDYEKDVPVECAPDWAAEDEEDDAPNWGTITFGRTLNGVEYPYFCSFAAEPDGPAESMIVLDDENGDDIYVEALHHYLDLFEEEEP